MASASLVSIIIASLALLVSLVALWKTHFAKGRVVSAVGSLRVHLYPFRNEKARWYISGFDAPFTLTNAGARPVLITATRLRFHYADIPIPENREFIYPKWEIEPAEAGQISARKRFEWIDTLTKGKAMAFPLIPKETVTKHLIYETRWDDPVVQKRVKVALEIKIDGVKAWQEIGDWQISLSAATWGELTNRGTSIAFDPSTSPRQFHETTPEDLHKYTGSKDPIPANGFGASSSHLDFPPGES
jgi:hypothetical protein